MFTAVIEDSMNINYTPISAQSSAMGGIYIPYNLNEKIAFSHLSRFGGLYTLDALQYNNILFTINGVDDIPNTIDAWSAVDDDGPDANEIDYSKISYFDVKNYNILLSRIIKNKYNISIKSTFSKIYNQSGIGVGLNIVTTKRIYKHFNYYLGIYDLLSFKLWNNLDYSNIEFYDPKVMISLERQILKSLNILTLYGFYEDSNGNSRIDYRFGSKISLTDNIEVFLGKSTFSKISMGFSIANNLFNIDYSYIISSKELPFNDSYSIGIGINISALAEKGKDFYP